MLGNGFEMSRVLGNCLLYTSDAADDMQCVDLGGGRIIKKPHPFSMAVKICIVGYILQFL